MTTLVSGNNPDNMFYENTLVTLYRGRHPEDNLPVMVKVIKEKFARVGRAVFAKEMETTGNLNIKGLLRPRYLGEYSNQPFIMLEDPEGVILKDIIPVNPNELDIFLTLAIRLCGVLEELHQNKVIHGDLRPDNIFVLRDRWRVQVTGSGGLAAAVWEKQEVSKDEALDILSYISPEQTGSLSREVDYRTDIYSLGTVFYEMLTGLPPFRAADPLELIHAVVAKVPDPPHMLNREIQSPLSTVIMKTLSKDPRDRYQSAYGLKMDLEECLNRWNRTGKIEKFHLARKDVSGILRFSGKLYGRQREIAVLKEVINRVKEGGSEVVLVTGGAGVGKTSLVNDAVANALQGQGFFISGKFEQIKADVPYAPFAQAFKELLQRILAKGDKEFLWWKRKILQALEGNGSVIIEIIPELKLVIGPQQAARPLPPSETGNELFAMSRKRR